MAALEQRIAVQLDSHPTSFRHKKNADRCGRYIAGCSNRIDLLSCAKGLLPFEVGEWGLSCLLSVNGTGKKEREGKSRRETSSILFAGRSLRSLINGTHGRTGRVLFRFFPFFSGRFYVSCVGCLTLMSCGLNDPFVPFSHLFYSTFSR